MTQITIGARGRARCIGLLAMGAVLPLGACDLDVIDPQIVQPGQLQGIEALPTLFAGALGDFGIAYAGAPGSEGIILTGGLRSDEWSNRDTFGTRQEIDRGDIQIDNAGNQGTFRFLQRARASAELAADRFADFGPTDAGHAESLSLAGFTYVLLGEHYCSGIPFSTLTPDGVFEFGEPLSTAQVFELAIERFDQAIAAATAADDPDQEDLARIGRGRALVNLGRFQDAAVAVAGVPVDFIYGIEYSDNTPRQNNAVFIFNNIQRRWGVADLEGGNGLPFVTADDPRTPTALGANGLDNRGPVRNQLLYPDRTASIPVATGVEARLIVAEAALERGDAGAFLATHNDLRAEAGLSPLVPTGGDLVELHFSERGFWLFLTGHRLGDMRRLLRAPYNRPFSDVFPVGPYFKGGEYGTDANLPIPVDELNNPNFDACSDRTS